MLVRGRAGAFRAGSRSLGVGALAIVIGAAPARAEIEVTDELEIGGHVELSYERLQNLDLDDASDDDLDLLPGEIELSAAFEPSEVFLTYVQLLLLRETVLDGPDDEIDEDAQLLVEEAFFDLRDPASGLALRVGRQNFEDQRQWVYDADLDGIRGFWLQPRFALELSASREALVQQDLLRQRDVEPIANYILYGSHALGDEVTLGAYGIVQDFRDEEDTRPVFFGLQSFGTIGERLTFWLDAAHVVGTEEGRKLRGFGFDALGTWRLAAPLQPYLIFGYAFGSGDSDPDDERDTAFRQTGLQANETEVGGLTDFIYYGEAFDPELSNMSIFTAGIGARPSEGSSVDLVYHYYLQVEPSDELRDAGIDADPSGESRRLGSEIDLILGYEEIENVRLRGYLGYFIPGRAFADASGNALVARIEARYEF